MASTEETRESEEGDPVRTVLEEVPDRPPASLYDVACLYTACDRYERLTEATVPASMRPKDVSMVTVADDLLSDDHTRSIVAARVDLSGDDPELADPPVTVRNYTPDRRFELGYVKNIQKAGAATDYSITNHSGQSATKVGTLAHDTWMNRFLRGRFENWPTRDGPQTVADGHEDGWIIDDLATLGEDEAAMTRLEEALLEEADFEETQALVTVQIRLEEGGEFLWPGEIPVLNEAAYERRREHFRDGISMPDADPMGEGTGFVTGDDGRVTGGSPGVLDQFGKKQPELFPGLDKNEAWRTRPLVADTAATINRFGNVVDDFSTLFQGVSFYFLPYPETEVTPSVFERFFEEVYQPLAEADGETFLDEVVRLFEDEVPVERMVEATSVESDAIAQFLEATGDEAADDEAAADEAAGDEPTGPPTTTRFDGRGSWLKVYGLFVAKGLDPTQVFVDEPAISLGQLTDLEDAYRNLALDLRQSTLFGGLVDATDYVRPDHDVARAVLGGRWFHSTTAESPDPDDPSDDDPAPDDPLVTLAGKLVRGERIRTDELLRLFNLRIERQFRDNQSTDQQPFPTNLLLGQYARLVALGNSDLLVENNIPGTCEHEDAFMSHAEAVDGDMSREDRLESFLDAHAALDSPESQSCFLLGALVGRLTALQYSEGVSRKLVEQHPASSITKRSIASVASAVLEKNETYSHMEEGRGQMNRRYTERLADVMLRQDPDEWALTTQEMRWLYSLGIAYGKSDTYVETDDE